MDNLSKQDLIDRYNQALKPFLDEQRLVCPQCFSDHKETIGNMWHFECGTRMRRDGVGGITSTARCYRKALTRPIDIGNTDPYGYPYELFV